MLEIAHLLGKKKQQKKTNLKAQKPFCQRPELNTPVPLRQNKLAENEIINILAHMHENPHIVCSL